MFPADKIRKIIIIKKIKTFSVTFTSFSFCLIILIFLILQILAYSEIRGNDNKCSYFYYIFNVAINIFAFIHCKCDLNNTQTIFIRFTS